MLPVKENSNSSSYFRLPANKWIVGGITLTCMAATVAWRIFANSSPDSSLNSVPDLSLKNLQEGRVVGLDYLYSCFFKYSRSLETSGCPSYQECADLFKQATGQTWGVGDNTL